ncbi:hypothetical protein [Bacillus haynesii]|nr:hypothetical protein [Bacillus haynesii]
MGLIGPHIAKPIVGNWRRCEKKSYHFQIY